MKEKYLFVNFNKYSYSKKSWDTKVSVSWKVSVIILSDSCEWDEMSSDIDPAI